MKLNGRAPFDFQEKLWAKYEKGYNGMLVAPTGFGKTYAVFLGLIIDAINHPERYKSGLKMIWITPLRSLSADIAKAMQNAIDELGLDWVPETRNGDTDPNVKKRQSKQLPDILVLTPESLHLLLAQKSRNQFFKHLRCVTVDEWHELMSTKRGVMVELALAFLRFHFPKQFTTWGISATIGNIDEAMEVLIPAKTKRSKIIAALHKKINIIPLLPDEVEVLPWGGHLGAKMVEKVVPVIQHSKSTIAFTNTRSQSEFWYQMLLDAYPDFAGLLALHHSSIDAHIRLWIEEALSSGKLKAVVATSSLDLGVDFKPVDTIVQIGSSKGIARFLQRAGRSGHSPFETSTIYFVPTNALELIEIAALKEAIHTNSIESREPLVLTFDVLVQFMVTIALGGGFKDDELLQVVKRTHAFSYINEEEWKWCLLFITKGGAIGAQYEEFHKVVQNEEGLYVVTSRRIGMLHRINMGVIVSDAMVKVKFLTGGYIGMVEEYFLSKLKSGDKFILAGRVLEYVRIKEMTALVKSSSGKAITPSWLGGRLPFTTNLAQFLRKKIAEAAVEKIKEPELKFLQPLLDKQKELSHLPTQDEFLIEQIKTREGYHIFMYPFEGRLVHEVMATLIAYRISRKSSITFSIAMNDYGFELFSDQEVDLDESNLRELLNKERLMDDVISSINATEMANRKFREIAVIGGMVIQNYYGKRKSNKSLQASSNIIFKVLEDHEPNNLLLRQAYTEVFNQQLEEVRLKAAFMRINKCELILTKSERFTPLSFPIKIESIRNSLTSEALAERIMKLQAIGVKKTKK